MKTVEEMLPGTRTPDGLLRVAEDVHGLRVVMVNVYFVGRAGSGDWVLVDAGMPFSAGTIRKHAERLYGAGARPRAILLTHGHFDHVGAVRELARGWDVPVYAHELELPYVTGRSAYPPPDGTVGGGLMARLSPLYPRGPIDISEHVRMLPADNSIPDLPEWRWLHTPGHTPGHVSFFRESDRVLIAGDAFVTTQQESFWSVLTQRMEIHGPPMYYTPNFGEAWRSVQRLAALDPAVAGTGHGMPMAGPELTRGLERLASDFGHLAMPEDGRYVRHPAIVNAEGVVWVPPAAPDPMAKVVATVALSAAVGAVLTYAVRRNRH